MAMTFGQNIKTIRSAANLKQSQVAQALGLSLHSYRQVELGHLYLQLKDFNHVMALCKQSVKNVVDAWEELTEQLKLAEEQYGNEP